MDTTSENTSRPFGYWLKATDRLMAAEFAAAFESFGVTRRDWRLLNRVDGSAPGEDRPLPAHKLRRLIELGWVTDADGTWTLTDEGRDAKERLGAIVEGIRAKVTDAVPTEDLATTIATLEQLARAFGWDENTPLPRKRRHPHGRGFGHHGHGRAAHGGPRRDGREGCRDGQHPFAGDAGHGHRHHGHGHGHGHGPTRARFARFAQGAYERGFDAGFRRGRS